MLLDAGDLALAPRVEAVVTAIGDGRVKRELMQCQIELATSPQRTVAAAEEELRELRSRVVRVGAQLGRAPRGCRHAPVLALRVPAAHGARSLPRARPPPCAIPLRREACFGMHVHVAVGSADKAMRVIEAMLWDLPLLLALSTSSPFWRGEPTGLHSTRTVVFQSLPRSGLPPAFGCYEDFARGVERLARAGALPDHSYLWWDVRPHPRSAPSRSGSWTPSRASATASRSPGSCRRSCATTAGATTVASASRMPIASSSPRTAGWPRATGCTPRWSISASDTSVPARRLVEELLDRVADDAAALDATEALDRMAAIVRAGTSADRQLALHRERRVAARDRPVARRRDAELIHGGTSPEVLGGSLEPDLRRSNRCGLASGLIRATSDCETMPTSFPDETTGAGARGAPRSALDLLERLLRLHRHDPVRGDFADAACRRRRGRQQARGARDHDP